MVWPVVGRGPTESRRPQPQSRSDGPVTARRRPGCCRLWTTGRRGSPPVGREGAVVSTCMQAAVAIGRLEGEDTHLLRRFVLAPSCRLLGFRRGFGRTLGRTRQLNKAHIRAAPRPFGIHRRRERRGTKWLRLEGLLARGWTRRLSGPRAAQVAEACVRRTGCRLGHGHRWGEGDGRLPREGRARRRGRRCTTDERCAERGRGHEVRSIHGWAGGGHGRHHERVVQERELGGRWRRTECRCRRCRLPRAR